MTLPKPPFLGRTVYNQIAMKRGCREYPVLSEKIEYIAFIEETDVIVVIDVCEPPIHRSSCKQRYCGIAMGPTGAVGQICLAHEADGWTQFYVELLETPR